MSWFANRNLQCSIKPNSHSERQMCKTDKNSIENYVKTKKKKKSGPYK